MTARSILITGCSSGIGHDAAHRLKALGWRVFATCRKPEDCARLEGEGLESFPLDHTDEATIHAAIAEALSRTGGTLDALWLNGAYGLPGAAEDLPSGALRDLLETAVVGVHETIRTAMPAMRAQGHGRVLVTGSVLGYSTIRWRTAYVAAKYALEGLTDTWRLEMAPANIKVSLIECGPITTDFRKKSLPHFERWIDWKNAPQAELYKATLIKRLYDPNPRPDPFEAPPSAVTAKAIRALNARRPRPRYFVTPPAFTAWMARRFLPTRLIDRIQGWV